MRNIVLHLSYDGTGYHGFQRQNNAVTIQEIVETAIFGATGEKSVITGCSRTDAGVHAREYVCNFFTGSSIPEDKFMFALKRYLPADITCTASFCADENFHSRYSAKSKTYSYKIYNKPAQNALYARFAYHYPVRLNIEKMKEAAEFFTGVHDFTAFMASGGQQKTTVKTVNSLTVDESGGVVEIRINADGFLYNMVRIISGTLIYTGCGKILPEEIPHIIESRERSRAGFTAPACGLCLERVYY